MLGGNRQMFRQKVYQGILYNQEKIIFGGTTLCSALRT